jgi:hypothetical protein
LLFLSTGFHLRGKCVWSGRGQDLEDTERHFSRSSANISVPSASDSQGAPTAPSGVPAVDDSASDDGDWTPNLSDPMGSRPFTFSDGTLAVGEPGAFHSDLATGAFVKSDLQVIRGRLDEQEDGSWALTLYEGRSLDDCRAAEDAVMEWAQRHGFRLEV